MMKRRREREDDEKEERKDRVRVCKKGGNVPHEVMHEISIKQYATVRCILY